MKFYTTIYFDWLVSPRLTIVLYEFLSHPFFLYLMWNNTSPLFFIIYYDVYSVSNIQGSFLYFFVFCSVEQKICLSFNFSFVPRTSPPSPVLKWKNNFPSCTIHRFKVLFFTMLFQTANFLTHMKKGQQSSNLKVYKGLRTNENKFLQAGLALSGSLGILRSGPWKPARTLTCQHRWPSSEARVCVMANGGKPEELKSK